MIELSVKNSLAWIPFCYNGLSSKTMVPTLNNNNNSECQIKGKSHWSNKSCGNTGIKTHTCARYKQQKPKLVKRAQHKICSYALQAKAVAAPKEQKEMNT